MPEIDLELMGVTKKYGDVVAVDKVSLKVNCGEFLSLLGPSGCGKTTTLRLIAGLEQCTAGQVLIRGVDVAPLPPYERDVNTVFQNYALFPHMTVKRNIAFGPRMKKNPQKEIDQRVEEMLHLVGLNGYENRYPSQLSGGQQQRIAVARALINKPLILLLDEPLGALDLKLRKQMQIELKGIHKATGKTFIYVTHDQEEAMILSDRIVVMNYGKIVQMGSPKQIYEKPRSRFVAFFIGESNFLDATVLGYDSDRLDVQVEGIPNPMVALSGAYPIGAKITLCVRPEKMIISRPGKALRGTNVVYGRVQHSIYVGEKTLYHVKLNGTDTEVKVVIPFESAYHELEEVAVSWDPADTVALQD